MRDDCTASCIEKKALKDHRHREKEKMKWARLKQVFDKSRFNSIDAGECIKDGFLARTSEKLEMEKEIVNENQIRFQLA